MAMIRNLCAIILAVCVVMPISSATVYTVGDAAGWGLSTDYSTWASDKTFVIGDSLVFNYDSSHSVAEVSPSDYSSCSSANAISSENDGATTIPLKTAGVHNFICGVSFHCSSGMKLSVTVTTGGTTPTPSGGTTPTPSGGTSPTTPTTGDTSPPTTTGSHTPSSSSKLAVSVAWLGFFAALVVMS